MKQMSLALHQIVFLLGFFCGHSFVMDVLFE